jgi:tetratricopeptide (TPR) repeat protein
VKRGLAIAGLVVVVAIGVLLVDHATGERRYTRLLQTGQAALDAGNSYAAVEAFTGALTLRPTSMVAFYRRGEAYRLQHRDDQAIRDFRTASRLAPEAPQPLITLGEMYESADPAEAALLYGQAAAQLKSDDPALLYKLAVARYRAGLPAEALDPLRRIVARNDSLPEAQYLLGVAYRDTQQPDQAVRALEHAVKLSPSLTAAREELADLYRERGMFVEEMNQLQALALLDDLGSRTVSIALAEARQGQVPAALGALVEKAERSPADAQMQLTFGRIYLARAEQTADRLSIARALDALERALADTSRRSEALALFGRALWLSRDAEGSERILREAVATSPVDPEAFGYLADVAEQLSQYEEARDALKTLDVLQGDTAPAPVRAVRAQRLASLSLRVNDFPTAIDYLSRVVAAGRADGSTYGALAEAKLKSGDRAGAVVAVTQGLALDPRHGELLRLRRTLR